MKYYNKSEKQNKLCHNIMRSFLNKIMSSLFDKSIKRAYARVGWHWYNLPFYLNIGKYKLCVYAMDMDWNSIRIKIDKDHQVYYVIKKGVY